jgi:hypothetical protein
MARRTTKTAKKTARRAANTGRTKLLPKHHTGKLQPHKHTSYGILAVLLIVALIPLFIVSRAAVSADDEGIQIFAVVPGPIPGVAPGITNMVTGRSFNTAGPQAVRGTCPPDTLVKLFKNNVLAGAAFCGSDGSFKITADLLPGENQLVVRAYNANDAAGPAANPVTVQYAPPAGDGFYLTSQAQYRGVEVGHTMSRPVTIVGGTPPYAVSIIWGDGDSGLVSRSAAGSFDVQHAYKSRGPGRLGDSTIVIKATDHAGNAAYMQLAQIVSGSEPGVVATVTRGYDWSAALRTAWQLFGVAAVALLAFWLGEQREARLLRPFIGRRTA